MTYAVYSVIVIFSILLVIYIGIIAFLICNQVKLKSSQQINENTYLIVYASQSGHVEAYAQQTAEQLIAYHEHVVLVNIQDLTILQLQQAHKILWMVSTYGEGDSPDTARRFISELKDQACALPYQSYAILAFGDRRYTKFCQFGLDLDAYLQKAQAKSWFDVVSVDQNSIQDLAIWQQHLSRITTHAFELIHQHKDWSELDLVQRELLNVGSQGTGLYHIVLKNENLHWQAGDILEICCENSDQSITNFLTAHHLDMQISPEDLRFKNLSSIQILDGLDKSTVLKELEELPIREYSIASIPAQGQIELVVRQQINESEQLGLGSGMLTVHKPLGSKLRGTIRMNPSFHLEQHDKPVIFIGNGSGIAGLIAHLEQRAQWGYTQNWLIYGERQQQFDYIFKDRLTMWEQNGVLEQLDVVFSRDQQLKNYVQDVVVDKASQIQQWVKQGALIYVCGSLNGMAQGVDLALTQVLGNVTMTKLRQENRYKRDVY